MMKDELCFKHFKGGIYRVLNVAVHTETNENLVIYCPIDQPDTIWARPLSMWNEEVKPGVKRFERIKTVTLIEGSTEHYDASKLYFSFIPTKKEAEDILLGGLRERERKNEDGSGDSVGSA